MRAAVDFEEAFDRLYGTSLGVARRLVGVSEAEEVAAEALTRAYTHWRRIHDKEWCEAWVVRVTANLALTSLRRRSWPMSGRRPPSAPTQVAMLDDLVVEQDSLVRALAELPRRQRQVVILRFLADISEADVAAALGLRPVTVRTHAQRGLAALRSTLNDDQEPIADQGPSAGQERRDPAHG